MTAGPAVLVDGLVKEYDGRRVLDGMSLTVAPGELVALLGPNGAGKTTTVEILEGYRRGDSGLVRVLGRDPASGGATLRARVGLMLQGGGVDPRARPREILRLFGRFHAGGREPDALLSVVGLDAVAETPYRRLSGGERQRLGLALALVGQPEVLVLDEPTAGMDPEARAVTRGIVSGARADGVAILLTSHDLSDVERLADRVVVLDGGQVVASGSPAELSATVQPTIRVRLNAPLSEADRARLERRVRAVAPPAAISTTSDPATYRIDGIGVEPRAVAAAVAAVAAACAELGAAIVELRTGGGSLEDAYLELVRSARDAAEEGPR